MFKFIFIISMLLPTVSAHEIRVNALNDLSLIEVNPAESLAEVEQTDDVYFDDTALIAQNSFQLPNYGYIILPYFSSSFLKAHQTCFRSRAPPKFI